MLVLSGVTIRHIFGSVNITKFVRGQQVERREFLKSGTAAVLAGSFLGCLPSRRTEPPNILFCIADDASYPHMGAYGCSWVKTPAFDRVARQGILFDNAYTPNAKCAPSRACILTGRNSWQLEEAANHWCFFPQKFTTYAEVLQENGYHVGYTAKGWAPGIALNADGEKRKLTGQAYDARKTQPPARFIDNTDYAGNFGDFLNDRNEGQPFCFWYGSREPHRRYEYGAGINKGGKKLSDLDKVFSFWPDNDTVRNDMLDYAFEIEYFDRHLAQMLDILEERGELDNTIVVVTADNGMPFPRIKGQEYELSNHLPLAIMWKDGIANPGRRVQDFVSFIDFTPTFLELAGVDHDKAGMQPIEGRSLTNIFASQRFRMIESDRDHVLIGKERHDVGRPGDAGYPIRGIVKDSYLYIKNFEPERWPAGDPETGYLNCDGSPTKTEILSADRSPGNKPYRQWSFGKRSEEEMYNIESDPECMENLAANPDLQSLKNSLRNQMIAELKKQGDPRMFGKGHIFDEYIYADKKTANFYERFMKGEALEANWVNPTDFE